MAKRLLVRPMNWGVAGRHIAHVEHVGVSRLSHGQQLRRY